MPPEPGDVSAIVGGSLPPALGPSGAVVFGGPGGIAWGGRWRQAGDRLLIDLDPAPMGGDAASDPRGNIIRRLRHGQ